MPSDIVAISDLRVDCVVGLYPHERQDPQPLRADIELSLDTERAAATEQLRWSVDYAAIAAQIAFLLQHGRFQLLETALHVLARYLLAPPAKGERRAAVDRLRLRLRKPSALASGGMPSIAIEREASWVKLRHEHKAFGIVDVIHETRETGIYRLNVAPGSAIPLHEHRVMREAEMVITNGLRCNGQVTSLGTVHRWPLGAAHCYENPTDRHQTILCVDSPPFDERDEVPVEGLPAKVLPEPAWNHYGATDGKEVDQR